MKIPEAGLELFSYGRRSDQRDGRRRKGDRAKNRPGGRFGPEPGMPLSVLSDIAREAPLGSLLIAFLLGVAVARRR